MIPLAAPITHTPTIVLGLIILALAVIVLVLIHAVSRKDAEIAAQDAELATLRADLKDAHLSIELLASNTDALGVLR